MVNKHNKVKNPTWSEANQARGYLTSVVEDLNSGLSWTNPASGQGSPTLSPLDHAAFSKKVNWWREMFNYGTKETKFIQNSGLA